MNYLKNIGLSLMALGTIAFTSCSNSQPSETPKTEESAQNNQEEKIDFENAFIVDVRSAQEFASGHYEGAVNIPVDQIESNLEKFEGHEQIVVYCRSGSRSGTAKNILVREGFTDIINAINLSHLNNLKKEQK